MAFGSEQRYEKTKIRQNSIVDLSVESIRWLRARTVLYHRRGLPTECYSDRDQYYFARYLMSRNR